MALLTPLAFDTAQRALLDYGLELERLEPMVEGSVNSNFRLWTSEGQRYFARIYEEQAPDGALAELKLVGELDGLGIPVAPALEQKDGSLLHEVAGKPFAVFPWVPGDILCQARVTTSATRTLGQTLARLHQSTASVTPLGRGRFGPENLNERLALVAREGDPALQSAARDVQHELLTLLPRRNPELPKGVTHTDLFRDNVLWSGNAIQALLDFESAAQGSFVYDLMVTLLAWCYGSTLDPELALGLLSGYHEVRPLSEAELSELEIEGRFACLRFATTRMTDYSLRCAQGAAPGRDFRRFLARKRELEQGALLPLLDRLRAQGQSATLS